MKHTILSSVVSFVIGLFLFVNFSPAKEHPIQPVAIPGNGKIVYGIMPGFLRYSGNVDEPVNSASFEAFMRVPLTFENDWSLYCSLGYSELEGVDNDANNPSRAFWTKNPFFYVMAEPGYNVVINEKWNLWFKAGLGFGSLKSVNPETEGFKVFIPTGVEVNYTLTPKWLFAATIGYHIGLSDFDGLKRNTDIDYRENDRLFNLSFGVGFTP